VDAKQGLWIKAKMFADSYSQQPFLQIHSQKQTFDVLCRQFMIGDIVSQVKVTN
jgi:hypothetical protein